MNLHVIQEELSGLKTIHGIELEREIHERRLHNGLGVVVQYISKKAKDYVIFLLLSPDTYWEPSPAGS